jgi:hypothetical protein
MANKILHKRSATATNIPTAGSLSYGELAINYADKKLYIKDAFDNVVCVGQDQAAVSSHIIPDADITYDLGSPTRQWRDVYIGPGSLYVNGQKVLEDNSGTIVVSADTDQNVQIKSTGTGDIEFLPSGTGIVQVKGALSILAGKNIMSSDGNAISISDHFTMNGNLVRGLGTPLLTDDAATKSYVDTAVSTGNAAQLNGFAGSYYLDWANTTNKPDPVITLAGDATGSVTLTDLGNGTLTVTIVDDSHNHVIANVDGLQTALDGKLNLTGGTLTGGVAINSGSAEALTVTTTTRDIVASFTSGDANCYITFADNNTSIAPYIGAVGDDLIMVAPGGTGTVTVQDNLTVTGNLTVQGTTTTVNSNNVHIGDNIITLSANETGVPSLNGGFEIERGTSTNVGLRWNETTDVWEASDNAGTYYPILTTNSTVDADTLGGVAVGSFVRSDAADTISGILTFNARPAFNGGTSGSTSPFTVDSTQVVANLNADLLDGQQGSYYAAASSLSSYLPLSGGTLTGALTVEGTNDIIVKPILYSGSQAFGGYLLRTDSVGSGWEAGFGIESDSGGAPVVAIYSPTDAAYGKQKRWETRTSQGEHIWYTGNPSTAKLILETNGTLHSALTNYETLVTDDDDIPNKKYVDDLAADYLPLDGTGLMSGTVVAGSTLGSFDPPGGGVGTDTSTTTAFAFKSGQQIAGWNDGYIRTLLKWTANSDIEIGQSGTAIIGGINLLPGSSGLAKVNGEQILTVGGGVVTGNTRFAAKLYTGTVAGVIGAEAGSLGIYTGDSGVASAWGGADDLVIENDSSAGISILTPNTDNGAIVFGDPDNNLRFRMQYTHSADVFQFLGASEIFRMYQDGRITTNGVTPLSTEAGSLTISTGDSGVTAASTVADGLIIEGSGSSGITIATPNNANGNIYFADPQGNARGQVFYNHPTESLQFVTAGAAALIIESNGTLHSALTNYETLVTDDDDIPNKKYVDDLAGNYLPLAGGTVTGNLTAGALGVSNNLATTGKGISLWNGATAGQPTYGLMFAGTPTFGTYGPVTGDWATYFTVNNTAGRGWIFKSNTGTAGNVAAISNTGAAEFAGTVTAPLFSGEATSAQYADLAEIYSADADIKPGTVVCFGGNAEVTTCMHDADRKVAGVVSTKPAHLMNAGAEGVAVALQGRVPCKVTGTVRKGDMMVSAGGGMARAEENPVLGSVIGKALQDYDGEVPGVIEVVVGRL